MRGVDPVTGELLDFTPLRGDSPEAHDVSKRGGARRRWGNRVLLSTNPLIPASGAVRATATLIDTGDLGQARAINLQMRFASVVAGFSGQAFLPFSPRANAFAAGLTLTVNVRRGTDPQAPPTVDSFAMPQQGLILPFDIVTARTFGVDVVLSGGTGAIWVEAVATVVEDIATANKVPGWAVSAPAFFASVASPAQVVLLPAFAARAQFIIVNTSTNADMIVKFGNGATWVGPSGSVVLPKNMFASYESPVGGYSGIVTGSWNNGAPDGGAIITEGTYF